MYRFVMGVFNLGRSFSWYVLFDIVYKGHVLDERASIWFDLIGKYIVWLTTDAVQLMFGAKRK